MDSRLRYSSIDLAYFFQDLRSDALKAISWPSRCGAIVIPASGDTETVNCAGTQVEATDRRTVECREERKVIVEQAVEGFEFGVIFTWWHHSIIVGGVVGTNRPHEAKHTATKHGCKKQIKCRVEEQDEA